MVKFPVGKSMLSWRTTGDVSTVASPDGKEHWVRFGPGAASVNQEINSSPLAIIDGGAVIDIQSADSQASIRLQCLDGKGTVIYDVSQTAKPHDLGQLGFYFKTPWQTRRMVVSVQKKGPATAVLRTVSLKTDGAGPSHKPQCDLRAYMRPLWRGGRVVDETVSMISEGADPASGQLMFLPERVELVRDARTGAIFSEGKDYTLHGRTLLLTAGSKIPFIRSGEFPKDKYPWFEANGRHLLVTYDHRLKWDGPIAEPQGSRFPNVMAKLKRRERLRVVAYGDSITHGLDVSSYLKQAPHMPTWAQMFVDELSAIHHDGGIELYNTALPGATSQWGIDNEEIGVTSINPDLVIIAFGMNDFWSLTPEQFKENIEKMLTKLHASCPKAEAVLVASMPFDPIYTSEQTYCENLAGYPAVLKSLAGPGVGFVDMYSIGKALYDAKKPKDLIENPMHPNDFLARWYAQSLIAALTD